MKNNIPKRAEWIERFNDKFIWSVMPIGVKKGDKVQEEYVLGTRMDDWNDDATLGDIKSFIQREIDAAYQRGFIDGNNSIPLAVPPSQLSTSKGE
jgi:hypothetical protein